MTFILKVEVSFVDHMNDNANATGFFLSPVFEESMRLRLKAHMQS